MNFSGALIVLAALAPAQQSSVEFYHDFRGGQPWPAHMRLFGPYAEAAVKVEQEGLRIKLPTGYEGQRPGTGLDAGVVIHGDFEITMGFEIIHEPEPEDTGIQTRLALAVTLDNTGQNMASLSRLVVKGGRRFVPWVTLRDEAVGKAVPRSDGVATAATKGRLRLVRTGSDLSYFVAPEGDEGFTHLRTYPFRTGEIKEVRMAAATGGPNAALDVRVTDIRIRAESLTNLPAAASVSALPRAPGRGWLVAGLVVGLAIAMATVFGVRSYLRRNQDAQSASV